ncbi:uncharacterized protein LOC100571362 [Acyrthosiphon pisum]|uniref:Uncharacterized protein n=2 Tax=Acyrthosiphon pisum TaxID=7029 RepID=C4WXQ1_ACYPI|nr:uncharacterized protein LOC100571362 [Acyrthosiphon pisum]BAH72671.1 hypothetical protein [Acyrthosiphon pisum]|eukprot:NP_001280459.1 uncharacterized protein LOC100571362 [Acyrthosiphon pisum]
MSCIRDLSKENYENYELQMHCLCTILQLVGPILSKTSYDLNEPVNKLLPSINNHGMSSTLKCLIQQVKRMHSKGWMDEGKKIKSGVGNQLKQKFVSPHGNLLVMQVNSIIGKTGLCVYLIIIVNLFDYIVK